MFDQCLYGVTRSGRAHHAIATTRTSIEGGDWVVRRRMINLLGHTAIEVEASPSEKLFEASLAEDVPAVKSVIDA